MVALSELWSVIKKALGIKRYILWITLTGLGGGFAWLFANLEKIAPGHSARPVSCFQAGEVH